MKNIVFLLALSLFAAPVFAGPQQEKMKTCNADAKAKALKGDERKAFMKQCLSTAGAPPAAAEKKMGQKDKMKKCNADAKGMKGDDRKKFMSECLKG
jgi:hypothetical protein